MTSFPPSKEENVAVWSVFPLQDMPEVVKKKVSKVEKQQIPVYWFSTPLRFSCNISFDL